MHIWQETAERTQHYLADSGKEPSHQVHVSLLKIICSGSAHRKSQKHSCTSSFPNCRKTITVAQCIFPVSSQGDPCFHLNFILAQGQIHCFIVLKKKKKKKEELLTEQFVTERNPMCTVVCELGLQPVQHMAPGRNLHTIAQPNKVKTSGTTINKVMLTYLVRGTKIIMQQTK